ncbi:hypothetical protein [Hymenobacter glacieicola]|uniref:DUF2007 domain-containing protein n=1 Tax=Hymenobacter glacieicola TaxID=1562124 RepID=A0ABQ1WNH7_9BACT|nr:hypothetical protein [Hymenobacter glacieicola]GGG36613.1 hypothetical protein GCM10011378_11260 [Hymenobacter glacieicola]
MSEFQSYQRFPNVEVAQPLLQLLHQHNIPYETKLDQPRIDPSFAFNPTNSYFVVQLRPEDFDIARTLELDANDALTVSAAPDHYLFSFSDEELLDVLLKPDEWNSFDVALARRILRQRGHDVSPALTERLRQQRLQDLARPEPPQKAWILFGYAMALLGGIVAVFIGWHLYSHKKQLPNGQQVLAFQPRDRAHGLRIVVLGGVCFLLALASRFLLGS